MRKNTCILIRNWRKLPQNTNRRICRSRQYLQTQEMNIKVTNIISDIPSCCASLGECGSSLILKHGIPHPPKIHILMPQAPGRHSLETGPTPTEACGFPGAGLTARCHHSHLESSCTHTGGPHHWWQAQSSGVGYHKDSSIRLFS